jgi:hypothetical protein
MFTIQKVQVALFSDSLGERFALRRAEHLRNDFRAERERFGIADDDLLRVVREGLNAAEGFGVIFEADQVLFAECLAALGPRFYESGAYPWASAALNHPGWSGSEKMDAIGNRLLFELRP